MDEPSASAKLRLRDLDELNDAVSGARLELVQLRPGPLEATVSHGRGGPFAIDEGTVNLPLRVRGPLDRKRCSLGLFHPGAQAVFNGYPVDPTRLLLFMPGRELNGFVRERFGWTSIVFPGEWLDPLLPDGLQGQAGCHAIRPETVTLARLRAAAGSLKKQLPSAATSPDRSGWLLADLRNALGEALATLNGEAAVRAAHSVGHFNTARRAERHMRERMDEPLCIDELCATLRVSRRYLEYAFNDAFGTSPSRYLRLLRLHEVRRRLKKGGAPTTVTREALRLGFNHLSLFSLQYKKAFGETPSATLSAKMRRASTWSYADHA